MKMPDKLLIETKELKIKLKLNWSQFLIYLCDTIPRPEKIQKNSKLKFKKTRFLDIRISSDAWIKFSTFSIVFKDHAHAIDFLLKEENKKVGFLSQF